MGKFYEYMYLRAIYQELRAVAVRATQSTHSHDRRLSLVFFRHQQSSRKNRLATWLGNQKATDEKGVSVLLSTL